MKYLNILILALCFISCREKENPVIINPPKDCMVPDVFKDPNTNGLPTHFPGRLSYDGKKMFFSRNQDNIFILDLQTLIVNKFDLASLLPKNIKLFGASASACDWCSYENNIFTGSGILLIDTVGDGKTFTSGYHLFKVSLNGELFQIITPEIIGKIGTPYGLGLDAWLPYSKKGEDYYNIGYRTSYYGKSKYHTYCPQTQLLTEQKYKNIRAYSINSVYYFCKIDDYTQKPTKLRLYINNTELIFKDSVNTNIGSGSFSPDGKFLAINVKIFDPMKDIDSSRLEEIWLIDVEKFMQNPANPVPIKIINLKEKFCMFSYGAVPTFITNNTMAVSMFKNGDTFSYLHEIDINGNYIRQLTFVP